MGGTVASENCLIMQRPACGRRRQLATQRRHVQTSSSVVAFALERPSIAPVNPQAPAPVAAEPSRQTEER